MTMDWEETSAWDAGDGAAYAKDDKGTTKHHAVRRIRFDTPDVAIVDIDNEVRG
jgi:hypothetical protein